MKLTRSRNWVAVIVLAALAALFCIGVFLNQCQDEITKTNFARIQDGMTLEQVTEILGPPTEPPISVNPNIISYKWEGLGGVAVVGIGNENGRVLGKAFVPLQDPSWCTRFKSFLGL